jgi:hypothetical protein
MRFSKNLHAPTPPNPGIIILSPCP